MMPELDMHIATTLGLLLGGCLAAGVLAEFLHLPKVTAYLLVGLAVGPHALDLIPHDHLDAFDPMLKLAMALVLFNLGSQFVVRRLLRIMNRALAISVAEVAATWVVVTGGLLAFGTPLPIAVLLGCLALATAPATTVLVLKEYRSEGPITETTGFLVAANNLAAIVAFEVALLTIHLVQGKLGMSFSREVGYLLQDIGGSLLLGAVAGLGLSYGCGVLRQSHWLVLLVATTTLVLGICESLGMPYMLTFLLMGMTIANSSGVSGRMGEELDHLTGLLCVLFFVVHGADLNVQAFFASGLIGIVYIMSRIIGKCVGVYGGSRATRQPIEVRHWLGPCLLAQAGAAIALAATAVRRDPELGEPVQTIILGSVVVFEILGPLLIRQSLLRSGEVPLAHAIRHSTRTPWEQVRDIIDRLRPPIGQKTGSGTPRSEATIEKLIRKTSGLPASAGFDEVISHIERSHDNTYPVVDDRSQVVGVLRYGHLVNVPFDKAVSRLVRAEDLTSPLGSVLYPDEAVTHAFDLFQVEADDCIPVVTRDPPHVLLGVVRRTDVLHMLVRRHRNVRSFLSGPA
jgi:Kef-type K+ transport system membrane component KefB